ncbi:hypothetical protein ACFFNA_36020 [Mesorhizobium kowhaii]|uniref:Mu transposase domain-containing protein n=1 Tax=Mesorhizobium kowhaii TaxID=1300272 RepID=UPI0035E80D23
MRADLGLVRVFDGAKMIASHRRSYDRDQQIEDPLARDNRCRDHHHRRDTRFSSRLGSSAYLVQVRRTSRLAVCRG